MMRTLLHREPCQCGHVEQLPSCSTIGKNGPSVTGTSHEYVRSPNNQSFHAPSSIWLVPPYLDFLPNTPCYCHGSDSDSLPYIGNFEQDHVSLYVFSCVQKLRVEQISNVII